jgi:Domain of unknown function (DUF5665)
LQGAPVVATQKAEQEGVRCPKYAARATRLKCENREICLFESPTLRNCPERFSFFGGILFYMEQQNESELLRSELRKLNKNFTWYMSFMRGVATGFGTAVGASILVALIAIIFQHLTGLPILGGLFAFLLGNLQ